MSDEPETIIVNRAPAVDALEPMEPPPPPVSVDAAASSADELPHVERPEPIGVNAPEPQPEEPRRKQRADKGRPRGPRNVKIPAGFVTEPPRAAEPVSPGTPAAPEAPKTRPTMMECIAAASADDKKTANEITEWVVKELPILTPIAGVYYRCVLHSMVHYGSMMNPHPLVSAAVAVGPVVAVQIKKMRQAAYDSEKTPVQQTAAAAPDLKSV